MSQQSFHQQTANGSNIAFTITTFSEDEIKVYVDGVESTNGGSSQNDYTIPNYTTNGGTVTWNTSGSLTAPASPSVVRVVRQTDVLNNGNTAVEGRATFTPGSSVKADDLNNNTKQVLRSLQEHNDQLIQTYDLQDGAVNSAKIKDASIVEGDLANSAVTSNKIANNAVTTTEILNGAVTRAKLEADAVDGTKLADNAVDSEHYTDGSIDREHLAADIIDGTKIANDAIDSEHYVDGSIDRAHLEADIIDSTKLADNAVGAEHIQAGAITGTEISTGTLDSRYYTKAQSDAAYFNVSTGDTIKDGDTFPDNDTTIATTAAINDRIIDLVDDVGGFVPIANETSFPATNPDVNNGTGTIVSVSAASTNLAPSGTTVTIANGAGTGNTVTITGVTATIPSGFGFLVETTSTLHTYTFHRLSPNATQVSTVADKATEIGRLGTADAVADMAILGTADVVADMAILGTNDVVADLNILGSADVVADMNTLAVTSVINNMDTVADAATNVNNVGSSITNVNNVAGALTNIGNVAGALTNVNNVGGSITNVNNVGNAISNVNTVAANLGTVNDFASRYSSGANNPVNNLDTGDLFFNTTSSSLKVYTGSAWVDGVTTTGNFALKTGNTFTGSNNHNDNVKSIYGTGSDLRIYHDGSFNKIDNSGTTPLYITVNDYGEYAAQFKANGAVNLYYDGSKKFESTADGIKVSGDIRFDSPPAKAISLPDNKRIYFGDGDDFWIGSNGSNGEVSGSLFYYNHQYYYDNVRIRLGHGQDLDIYHDGSDSWIKNSTGNLYINSKGNEVGIALIPDGAVELRHNDVKKFETTSTGATVTGALTAAGATFTSGVTFTGSSYNTNWVSSANTMRFYDNAVAGFGDADDLKIYHDPASGGSSFIDTTGSLQIHTSELYINNEANSERMIRCVQDGVVELYNNGNKKLETTSTGVTVTGTVAATSYTGDGSSLTGINTDLVSDTSPQLGGDLDANGNNIAVDGGNNITIGDNGRLRLGNSQDLDIYHQGTYSRITNTTGVLAIGSDSVQMESDDHSEILAKFITNGQCELYHDNSKRFYTRSNGATVQGNTSGAGLDFSTDTTHRGTVFFDNANKLHLYDSQGHDMITGLKDGAVELYHDNAKRLETTSDGVTISGNKLAIGTCQIFTNGNILLADNDELRFGTGEDLQIYHDGTNSNIYNGTGNLRIRAGNELLLETHDGEIHVKCIEDGSVELYHDNDKSMDTFGSGISVYGTGTTGYVGIYNQAGNDGNLAGYVRGYHNGSNASEIGFADENNNWALRCGIDGNTYSWRHFNPATNNTYDLGSSSYRWRNVYTNDLNLSNEGSSNDVDGTWGDWTIQEGESDLFLKNNRSGKKYKFNLTEVS